MKDIALMTTQERLENMTYDEVSKYIPTGKRTTPVEYYPVFTEQGVALYNSLSDMEKAVFKMPKEFIIPTKSFKKNRPEKREKPLTFKKENIKSSNSRKRKNNVLDN